MISPHTPAPAAHRRPTSPNEFRVEKVGRSPNIRGSQPLPTVDPTVTQYWDEAAYRQRVAGLLTAKEKQFSVTGHIQVDTSQLVLFFRSKVRLSLSIASMDRALIC